MEVLGEMDYSRMRQRISQLGHEEQILVDGLMRPGRMVRGTITWHKRREGTERVDGLYPGLNRVVGGKSIGRRVRVGHLQWLEALLGAYREQRKKMKRLREIHREIEQLGDRLRYEHLYDYEATVPGHLVRVEREAGDGQE